jgi:hypothetical protein
MKQGQQKEKKVPTLNPSHIRSTLEEVYNSERNQQKTNLKLRIDRALIELKPAEYEPLTSQVDSLKSQQLTSDALKEIVSDMASTKRDLTKESNKKEDRNQARIAELEGRYEKLKTRREAESKLAADVRAAQKVVNDKLKEDHKIVKEKFNELCAAHKKSENKKEKMETEGVNTFLQMLIDLNHESIKFIRVHNLFVKVINDSIDEFTRRFNEKMDEVDTIFQSFSLGKFMLSFSRRENLPQTQYLTDYINNIVTSKDCSINTASKERMREIFVNFMLSSVDCVIILYNGSSTRVTFNDTLSYYATAYHHMFGKDSSFTELVTRYCKELEEVIKKKGEDDGDESHIEDSQPAA